MRQNVTRHRYLVDGCEEHGVVRQEDREWIGHDTQLTTTLEAVEADHEVREQARTKHADSEVARDLPLLPFRIVGPHVVARSAVLQQAGYQQKSVGVW